MEHDDLARSWYGRITYRNWPLVNRSSRFETMNQAEQWLLATQDYKKNEILSKGVYPSKREPEITLEMIEGKAPESSWGKRV